MISTSYNKELIERNFSRYAHLYDRYSDIQRLMAARLIGQAPMDGIANILELGCGTGNYTLLLRKSFKASRIKALDISRNMIEAASQKLKDERIEFIIDDAEELNLNDTFDLVTSNAAFQWFANPEEALARYRNVIREEGVMLFSTFGPSTFFELSRSLKEVLGEKAALNSENFLEKEELEVMLGRHFRESAVSELVVKEVHPTLIGLLNKIRYTGARGSGVWSPSLWKRETLDRIEDIYKSRFGGIEASYQIFFFKAIK